MTDHSDIDHTGLTGVGAAAFSGARVYHNTTQSISISTWTSLLFNSERFDTDAFHDTGSNTSRLTAPSTGYYLIGGNCELAANSTGTARFARIYLNGTTRISDVGYGYTPVGGNVVRFSLTTIYHLTATHYVELQVFQDAGTISTGNTANSTPEFWIVKLG